MEEQVAQYVEQLVQEGQKSERTIDSYRRDLRDYTEYLYYKWQVHQISEVEQTHIIHYVNDLQRKGRSKRTIARHLSSIRSFHQYALRRQWTIQDATQYVDSPVIKDEEPVVLTVEEVQRLLEAPGNGVLAKRDRAILYTLYGTGIRMSELLQLNVSDISLEHRFLRVRGNKDKERIIPLHEEVVKYIEAYVATRENMMPDEALFQNLRKKRLSRQGCWKMMKKYADIARLDQTFSPEVLRRSFATHFVENGADLRTLQHLLGHQDLGTTERYIRGSEVPLKVAYERFHPFTKKEEIE